VVPAKRKWYRFGLLMTVLYITTAIAVANAHVHAPTTPTTRRVTMISGLGSAVIANANAPTPGTRSGVARGTSTQWLGLDKLFDQLRTYVRYVRTATSHGESADAGSRYCRHLTGCQLWLPLGTEPEAGYKRPRSRDAGQQEEQSHNRHHRDVGTTVRKCLKQQ
jgi:hypothetical protein